VAIEHTNVVDGAGYDDRHDGDPHAVHDVALNCAVDKDATAVRDVIWRDVTERDVIIA